jgi:hypothetical protein
MSCAEDFAYLWDGSDPGWILFRLRDGHSVMNPKKDKMLIIEQHEIAEQVIARMLASGARVISTREEFDREK